MEEKITPSIDDDTPVMRLHRLSSVQLIVYQLIVPSSGGQMYFVKRYTDVFTQCRNAFSVGQTACIPGRT